MKEQFEQYMGQIKTKKKIKKLASSLHLAFCVKIWFMDCVVTESQADLATFAFSQLPNPRLPGREHNTGSVCARGWDAILVI